MFSILMMNEGGAYEKSTGIFTAPVAGTYLFTVQLCLQAGSNFYYGIVADNIVQTSGKFYDNDSYTCNTADAILVLRPGQNVAIKCLYGYSGVQLLYDTSHTPPRSNQWNTFSGVLISK